MTEVITCSLANVCQAFYRAIAASDIKKITFDNLRLNQVTMMRKEDALGFP